MKLTRKNLIPGLAAEQLRQIGFKGNPEIEILKDGWTGLHRWPSRELEAEFRTWARLQMRLLMRWDWKKIEREWGAFLMVCGILPANEPTEGEREAEEMLADIDLDQVGEGEIGDQ